MGKSHELLNKMFAEAPSTPARESAPAPASESKPAPEAKETPTVEAKGGDAPAEKPSKEPKQKTPKAAKEDKPAAKAKSKGEEPAADEVDETDDAPEPDIADDASDTDEDLTGEERGRLAALKAERKQRQDWKARALKSEAEREEAKRRAEEAAQRQKDLEARLAALESGKRTEPTAEEIETGAEYFSNPVGALVGLMKGDTPLARAVREAVREELKVTKETETKEQRQAKYERSVQAASEKYPDFREAFDAFAQEAERNKYLYPHLATTDDPGEWIYRYVKRVRPALDGGMEATAEDDPSDTEAMIEKRVRAQIEQERRTKAAAAAANAMPKSQAGARGSGAKPGRQPETGSQLLNRMLAR